MSKSWREPRERGYKAPQREIDNLRDAEAREEISEALAAKGSENDGYSAQ